MAQHNSSTPVLLDSVFFALADPTRRKIIETVKKRDYTVVELSSLFDISLAAVSKHLKVLDNAKLLKRERNGKYILCHYNPQPMNEAVKWISKQYQFWNESFESLGAFLDANAKKEP